MFREPLPSLSHVGGRRARAAAAEPSRAATLQFVGVELAVWTTLYACYLVVRGAAIGSPSVAFANGTFAGAGIAAGVFWLVHPQPLFGHWFLPAAQRGPA